MRSYGDCTAVGSGTDNYGRYDYGDGWIKISTWVMSRWKISGSTQKLSDPEYRPRCKCAMTIPLPARNMMVGVERSGADKLVL